MKRRNPNTSRRMSSAYMEQFEPRQYLSVDLAPEAASTATISDTSIEVGQALTATWKVHNYGIGLISPFYVQFGLTRTVHGVDQTVSLGNPVKVSTIGGGASVTVTLSLSSFPDIAGGSWNLGVFVDSGLAIVESNENNNASTTFIPISVIKPDLCDNGDADSYFSPDTVQAGQSYSVNWGIKNSGTADAGSFEVDLYASRDQTITTADNYLGRVTVPSLAAGASTQINLSAYFPPIDGGVYYVGAIIDSTGVINESSEANNNVVDLDDYSDGSPLTVLPTIGIDNTTVAENAANAGFHVYLSSKSDQAITVQYSTSGHEALGYDDYQVTYGTLTFAPGETDKTINVPIINDTTPELTETFGMDLWSPANAVLASGQSDAWGTATINDDDPPAISINDVSVLEGNSGTTSATFTVTLSGPTSSTVTVAYSTSAATATAGSDYTVTSGTLTFNAGQTSKTITVPVIGDTSVESNETFNVLLYSQTNATIADGTGVGTITNDDSSTPMLSINDISVTEGNSGSLNAVFTVSLSSSSSSAVTVNYATSSQTATAGADYSVTGGTLTIPAGQTSGTVFVPILGDTLDESDETFDMVLFTPTNATIADSTGRATILDNDPLPSLAVNDISVIEGSAGMTNATFTVYLSEPSGRPVTVHYETTSQTASYPADFAYASGDLTFAPGQTSKIITVLVAGDTLGEAIETFALSLSAAGNATIADGTGVATIADDDSTPTVSIINDPTVTEGNSGTTPAAFTVVLSAASGQTVTVNYSTTNVTAQGTLDYIVTAGTLTFNPGETSKTISVPVAGETFVEPNETFNMVLTAATNATILDGTGTATIINDDAASISIADTSAWEGDSGSVNMQFTVSLSTASAQTITVNYATAGNTAADGSDYTGASGTLTFFSGQTSKTFNVPVLGDEIYEPGESFYVNLSSAANATIADGQAAGTILNDDAGPVITIDDLTINETSNGLGFATFAVSLSTPSSQPVTVQYATADLTATAGLDYVPVAGVLTFNPMETQKFITVSVNGDTLPEYDETFVMNLTNPSGGDIGDGQGSCEILQQTWSVPIGGKQKAVYYLDAAHKVKVTASLSGPGTGSVVLAGFDGTVYYGDARQVILNGDTSSKTKLNIAVSGKATTTIDSIQAPNGLASVTAPNIILRGAMSIGPSADPKAAVALKFSALADADIDSLMPIKSLAVAGAMTGSTVRSTSSIGAVTLGASFSSDILAGVDCSAGGTANPRHADDPADFVNQLASIKSITVKGLPVAKGQTPPRFVTDSNFSAETIGTVKLINVDFAGAPAPDAGQNFGIWAENLKPVTVIDTAHKRDKAYNWTWKPGDQLPGILNNLNLSPL